MFVCLVMVCVLKVKETPSSNRIIIQSYYLCLIKNFVISTAHTCDRPMAGNIYKHCN